MAQKLHLSEIESVVSELIIPFYRIERDMIIPGGLRRNETDAEHSWSVAFLACSLAPQIDPSLDVGKIAQFAIVHDLPEIYAGDVSVWDSSDKLAQKADREEQAQKLIASQYPHLPWINSTIQEYEQRDTPEAQFVYALDKFLALLIRKIDEGQAYIDRGLTREAFLEGLALSRTKAQAHAAVGEYYEQLWEIFEKSPAFFYQPEA